MPWMPLAHAALAVLFAAGASGCVSSRTSPEGVVPGASEVAYDPRGAWVLVETSDGAATPGEFLAVDGEAVHLLTQAGDYRQIERGRVTEMRMEAYRNAYGEAIAWGSLGAVSTYTHGLLLGLSAPVWGIAGATASYQQSKAGFKDVPWDWSWAQAAAYARFPAGMPEGLDPARLRFLPFSPGPSR